jgi:hypothetical protein
VVDSGARGGGVKERGVANGDVGMCYIDTIPRERDTVGVNNFNKDRENGSKDRGVGRVSESLEDVSKVARSKGFAFCRDDRGRRAEVGVDVRI